MTLLKQLFISNFTTGSGYILDIQLSYETFGQPLGTAPIVFVNHALTGNSTVAGNKGWWSDLIGRNRTIDTQLYTVIAFNVPGNGYDGTLISNYKDFIAKDIAKIFLDGLQQLNIKKLFAIVGGSLGGGIAWEMAVLNPKITEHLIPIATDWKSTDWLIANCHIQEKLLTNSKTPIQDARMHAMMCYRTPASFKNRFKRSINQDLQVFNVESWLQHHGNKLQERFQLSAYKLMNQLLKTIDITDGEEKNKERLQDIEAQITIVAVDSDLFFTAEENKETQKQLALKHSNVTYNEIQSIHGHDAFLIEYEQLDGILSPIFKGDHITNKKMKILKFGGKSLANGLGLERSINIIKRHIQAKERIAVVVSARANTTVILEEMLQLAVDGKAYHTIFEDFKAYQKEPKPEADVDKEFQKISTILEGVQLLGDYSEKIKDELLAQGELISVKIITAILKDYGINGNATDARTIIKTDSNFGNAKPLHNKSSALVKAHFNKFNGTTVNIVSGYIASDENGETTTLGKNGSNYSASLLANYLDAAELLNFTHVNGIYTANPDLVPEAQKIEELSFTEANELANFGTNVLHAKTIVPLIEKNIPLRILNTFNANDKGTIISHQSSKKGIRSLSVQDDISLINIEGRGLLGKVGIDARIFKALSIHKINVGIISQGSSERGISIVVKAEEALKAITALEREFETDVYHQDVTSIEVIDDVSVISIIGGALSNFHKVFNVLIKNQIQPILFNNTVSGENVSIVLKKKELHKAVNVIHGELFGISRKINIAVFGKGNVGEALINQITKSIKTIENRKGIRLNIFAIADSKKVLLDSNGVDLDWEKEFKNNAVSYDSLETIIAFAKSCHLGNLIAVDNTASASFVQNYNTLIEAGFDLVSSNKIANTIDLEFYDNLRKNLDTYQKQYLYETNVGAGLPLIDTIKLLHLSGENITKVRGVFSGSLSYIFNTFCDEDAPISKSILKAKELGFTEPDPRIDLSGTDVARKLLILARELDLKNELEDVQVQNLIPEHLRIGNTNDFLENISDLDTIYDKKKSQLKENEVLRYVGDLSGDLSRDDGAKLSVRLETISKTSSLGSLKGSDTIFEIYTESYGDRPIVIQGAGAGALVTACGVFGDVLRLSEKLNIQ